MSRRKGELSKSAIDSGWPHQVALPEHAYRGPHYYTVRYFIDEHVLSFCPRGHTFVRDGTYFNVFCFAEAEHAECFQQKFGGERMCPDTRPRWPSKPSPAERRKNTRSGDGSR